MIIKRISKCIWVINGVKVDIRKAKHPLRCTDERKALFAYFTRDGKNSAVGKYKLDSRICNLINRNLQLFNALNYQYIVVK